MSLLRVRDREEGNRLLRVAIESKLPGIRVPIILQLPEILHPDPHYPVMREERVQYHHELQWQLLQRGQLATWPYDPRDQVP